MQTGKQKQTKQVCATCKAQIIRILTFDFFQAYTN